MAISLFDWIYSISAMLFFSLIISIFIAVKKEKPDLVVKKIGIAFLSLSIPITLVLINYILVGKELWIIVLIIITMGLFLAQLFLDFIFKYDFRENWKTHVPYIILMYVVCFGFIFITIAIDPILGWIVSFLFWAFLGAVIYLYTGKRKKIKIE